MKKSENILLTKLGNTVFKQLPVPVQLVKGAAIEAMEQNISKYARQAASSFHQTEKRVLVVSDKPISKIYLPKPGKDVL